MRSICSGLAFLLLPLAASAQPAIIPAPGGSPDFLVMGAYIDNTMQPKSFTDHLQECVKNPVCKTALDGAALSLGVDSSQITTVMAAVPSRKVGEETYTTIQIPPEYQYCGLSLETISVVPATGDRASFMGITARPTEVVVYTWTPRRRATEGTTWVEARFSVTAVHQRVGDQYRASGKCKPLAAERTVLTCRGARGVNKGLPACGTFKD